MNQIKNDSELITWIKSLNLSFLYYSTLTLVPISFFFNILAILVFLRKIFKNNTNGFQNITLNLVNNMILIFVFLSYYTQSVGNDIRLTSNFACKLVSFILRSLVQLSSWIYVLIVAERVVCVTYPLQYRIFNKKRIVITSVVVTAFLILSILNSPNLLLNLVETPTNSSGNQTSISVICTGDGLVLKIRDIVVIIFRMIIPFILTLLLNIVLIVKLVKVKKNIRKGDSFMMREYKFAFSIIVLNVLFILTLIPNIVALIYSNLAPNAPEIATFMRQLSQLIASYNYCFNFFINLITNNMFRKELFKIMGLRVH